MQSLWVTTCVSKCPKDGDTKLECQTNSEVSSCNNNAATHSGYKVEVYDSSESTLLLSQLRAPSACRHRRRCRTR